MKVFINHDGGAKLQIVLKDMANRFKTAYAHAGTFNPDSAKVGLINEIGDPGHNLPPRPFMAVTFQRNYKKWLQTMLQELRKSTATSQTVVKAAGAEATADICKTLQASPALFKTNAPSTVAKKGFDYPLFERGKLFKSIRYKLSRGPL